MTYQQLIAPDLTRTVRPGWCLGYVSDVLGIRSNQYRSAWHAWLGTKHKHSKNEPLPDVPVPQPRPTRLVGSFPTT